MNLGPIMMGLSGFELNNLEKVQLLKPSIGGVILFTRNFKDIHQVKALIAAIRSLKSDLLIGVDHEGGRVQRFRKGFTHLPAMSKFGLVYDENSQMATEKVFSCGWILATELLQLGIDFSFTPVLDLDYGNSSAIGDRAFHSDPEVVTELAGSLMDGIHQAGMKCVGKHFPGHGYVKDDSHYNLPVDERPIEEIRRDMSCFKGMIDKGLDAIMMAHVLYSKIDDKPSGFSSKWIKDILKTEWRFDGVVFSDDLSMNGAHFIENNIERVRLSLESGCDMVLICNHPEFINEVIDLEWHCSEKLMSMKGMKKIDFCNDTIDYHLNKIKTLI